MKSKTWLRDRNFEFKIGDIVKCVRKKNNGHPILLEIGSTYKVLDLKNENLFITHLDNTEISGSNYVKVNKYYFIPLEKVREQLINYILSNDQSR